MRWGKAWVIEEKERERENMTYLKTSELGKGVCKKKPIWTSIGTWVVAGIFWFLSLEDLEFSIDVIIGEEWGPPPEAKVNPSNIPVISLWAFSPIEAGSLPNKALKNKGTIQRW